MPIYPAVLEMFKAQADINATNAQTQFHVAQTDQLRSKTASDEAYRKALMDFQAAQDAAGVTTPGAPKKDDEGFENNPQVQAINRTIEAAKNDANVQRQLASLARRAGNGPAAQQADDNARQSDQNAQQGVLRLQEERKGIMRRIGASAGSATEATLPQVKTQLDDLAPGWDTRTVVDRDNTGAVTWGPRTEKALDQLSKRAMTSYQQGDLGIKGVRAEIAADAQATNEAKAAEAQREHDRADRRARDRLNLAEREYKRRVGEDSRRQQRFEDSSEYRAAVANNRMEEQLVKRGERVQTELDKEYVIKHLPEFEIANQAAADVMKSFNEGGQRAVTQPQAAALAAALRQTMQQFKPGSGNKYSDQRLKDMQGMLQKAEGYFSSIGEGNVRPDKQTLQDMAHQVNQAYAVVVEEAAKATLRHKDRAATRGVDPDAIQGRGNLDALEQAGKVRSMPAADGGTIYFFGPAIKDPKKAVEGETVFKVGKARPRRKFKAGPAQVGGPGYEDDDEED